MRARPVSPLDRLRLVMCAATRVILRSIGYSPWVMSQVGTYLWLIFSATWAGMSLLHETSRRPSEYRSTGNGEGEEGAEETVEEINKSEIILGSSATDAVHHSDITRRTAKLKRTHQSIPEYSCSRIDGIL